MTKKKIGIWMYENDNGINIKKKLKEKVSRKSFKK